MKFSGLRTHEVADLLGLTLWHVYRLGQEAKYHFPPPRFRIGIVKFYDRNEVLWWKRHHIDKRQFNGRKSRKRRQ